MAAADDGQPPPPFADATRDTLYDGANAGFTGLRLEEKQVPAPAFDPGYITESCGVKAITSAFLGGGMGVLFGIMLASYENIAPPMPVPGQKAIPTGPLKEALASAYRGTAIKSRAWAGNFFTITGLFTGLDCVIEKARGEHDILNGILSGCAVGASMQAKSGPASAAFGCAGFAAFSGVIGYFTEH